MRGWLVKNKKDLDIDGIMYKLVSFEDLSRNRITQIADVHFRGQNGLQELDLSRNRINSLSSGVFYHMPVSFNLFIACLDKIFILSMYSL